MKFLVVEDSPTQRRIVVNTLRRLGYDDIVEAEDGAQGLALLDSTVDFIITDWNMPKMSGLSFVRAVRNGPVVSGVPILMVTTRSVREDIIQAAQAGVSNYVVKPFTTEVLKQKIEQILGAGV